MSTTQRKLLLCSLRRQAGLNHDDAEDIPNPSAANWHAVFLLIHREASLIAALRVNASNESCS
jgi:hypothetical protein